MARDDGEVFEFVILVVLTGMLGLALWLYFERQKAAAWLDQEGSNIAGAVSSRLYDAGAPDSISGPVNRFLGWLSSWLGQWNNEPAYQAYQAGPAPSDVQGSDSYLADSGWNDGSNGADQTNTENAQ